MTSETFIGRQRILDLRIRLVGYEFLFHASGEASSLDMTNRFEASIRVVRNPFSSKDTGEFFGGKLAFINVSVELLPSGLLEMLPATSVVLDLDAQVPASKEVEGALEQLQQRGFSFGLDDFAQDAPSAGLLSWATYVKLDCQHYGPDELAEACANASSKSKTLIAKGIETKEQTQTIAPLGVKLFQGYYFARPVMLAAKVLNPAVLSVIELLRLVRADTPVRALEDILKFDPVLSFKLLRYVNSAAFGTRGEIISFPQTVAVLGYQNLYR